MRQMGLEVWPVLATYAPAIFPVLAVVGAVNLALISRQEQREAAVERKKEESRAHHQAKGEASGNSNPDTLLAAGRAMRNARMEALLGFYVSNPGAGPTEAGRAVGVSRQTVYTYLTELDDIGRINRDNGTVRVLGGRQCEQMPRGSDLLDPFDARERSQST